MEHRDDTQTETLSPERIAAVMAEDARRAGIPVVRAYFDEHEAIIFEVARPRGHG